MSLSDKNKKTGKCKSGVEKDPYHSIHIKIEVDEDVSPPHIFFSVSHFVCILDVFYLFLSNVAL